MSLKYEDKSIGVTTEVSEENNACLEVMVKKDPW